MIGEVGDSKVLVQGACERLNGVEVVEDILFDDLVPAEHHFSLCNLSFLLANVIHMLVDANNSITWNPAYAVAKRNGQIYCVSKRDEVALDGELYIALLPLLKEGRFSGDEIAARLKEQFPSEQVYFALMRLEKNQLLSATDPSISPELATFFSEINVDASGAKKRLSKTRLFCLPKATASLHACLELWGIAQTESLEEATLTFVLTDQFEQALQDPLVLESWKRGVPLLFGNPFGSLLYFGPYLVRQKTGCPHCLLTRMQKAQPIRTELEKERKSQACGLIESGLSLLVTELIKQILQGDEGALLGKMRSLDTIDWESASHTLIRDPECSLCGSLSSRKTGEVLFSRQEMHCDGQQIGTRRLGLEEAWEQYSPLVSPIMGVVPFVQMSQSQKTKKLFATTSGANLAVRKSQKGLGHFRSFCGGKGTSELAAKVGGICESIERTSGVFRPSDETLRTSFLDLGDRAIHPDEILLYSDAQMQRRETWNQECHPFAWVAEPFPEDQELAYSSLWSLTEKREKFLPTALCYYGGPDLSLWDVAANSNGCAAGSCIEEAALQGFFELIERDAVALWWYNRLPRPSVDLASVSHPFIPVMKKEYEKLGRTFWVLDITSDFGIPSFVALSHFPDAKVEMITMGFGTHFDAETALLRALTEMNQTLVQAEMDPHTLPKGEEWLRETHLQNEPYLQPGPKIQLQSLPSFGELDLLSSLEKAQELVAKKGMEMLILDQSRSEFMLSVVRVVVPGLRHFWLRLAPGRLYEVPVSMGWLENAHTETTLNPTAMFL